MSSLAEQYDRIERYLQGAMAPGELDEFTQEIASDTELASAVNLHRELAETLGGESVHQFRQTLRKVDAHWRSSKGGGLFRVLKSPRILALAASILLLLGFFAWFGLQGPNIQELAVAGFEPLPLQTQMGSYEDNLPQIRNQANQAYIAKDFARAAVLFEELVKLEPFNLNNQLYAGISRLGNHETGEAIHHLRPLADGEDKNVQSEAGWYLALAFMQAGNSDSARLYLTRVAQAKGFNWEKAAGVLRNFR